MALEVPDSEHVEVLKKSVSQVGFLHNVVVNKSNPQDILSGRHRKLASKDWPEREEEVKSNLHRELIIIHANIQRQVSKEVTEHRFLRIARILATTGGLINCLENGKLKTKMIDPVPSEDVCEKMAELLPYSPQHIRSFLPDEFKHIEKRRVQPAPAKPLSQKLIKTLLQPLTNTFESNEPSYPYPECKCKTCPKRNQCY